VAAFSALKAGTLTQWCILLRPFAPITITHRQYQRCVPPACARVETARRTHCAFMFWRLGKWRTGHASLRRECATSIAVLQSWLVAKPTCAIILLDCHHQGVVESEVAPQWTVFEAVYVVRLVVRHCPRLQIPPALQRFGSLNVLKLYNTTIDDWSRDSALSEMHHPRISTLVFVRMLLPNGALPNGVISPTFPKSLVSIQVCHTNLSALPADLDTSWPRNGYILFESSLFTAAPPVLKRLQPLQLSLHTAFPYDVVSWEGLLIFNRRGQPNHIAPGRDNHYLDQLHGAAHTHRYQHHHAPVVGRSHANAQGPTLGV
jgi:hypothetical protein